MQSLEQPKTLMMFMLLKQNGLSLIPTGIGMGPGMTSGFFVNRSEAEYARTMAILGDSNSAQTHYHIFELEIPNPAYRGE